MNDHLTSDIQLQFDYTELDPLTATTLQTYASEIRVLMAQTVENILEVGKRLKDAQELLRHNKQGGLEAWIKTEFNWSRKQAYRLINVYDKFGNCVKLTQLDIATSALYQLAAPGIPEEVRQEAIQRAEQGEPITYTTAKNLIARAKNDPKLRTIVNQTAKYFRDEKREQQAAHRYQQIRQTEIPSSANMTDIYTTSTKYRIIYADPPWFYSNEYTKAMVGSTRPEDHYSSMKTPDICDLPVSRILQEKAVLFLWATTAHIMDALTEVCPTWGFKYKTFMVWDKIGHNWGPYISVRHEVLLICTRGSCTPDVNILHDSVQSIEKTEHSEKPERFREIIDELYPYGNRIELFARAITPHWDFWGNQIHSQLMSRN